jgi:hypothetical protein
MAPLGIVRNTDVVESTRGVASKTLRCISTVEVTRHLTDIVAFIASYVGGAFAVPCIGCIAAQAEERVVSHD